jgi:hypothetical protein
MDLNKLLLDKDIDPRQVLVLRHRPWESELNKVLPTARATLVPPTAWTIFSADGRITRRTGMAAIACFASVILGISGSASCNASRRIWMPTT